MSDIKRRTSSQDNADLRRPWMCPMCKKAAPLSGRCMMTWLDVSTESMRTALVCVECAPQSAPYEPDGLSVHQRTKKH